MNNHENKVLAEKQIQTTLIVAGETYSECKETETLIQMTQCQCGEINMVFCSDKGAGEFVNLQIPPEAVTNVLEQFRKVKE